MKNYRPEKSQWGSSKSTRKPRQKKELPVSQAFLVSSDRPQEEPQESTQKRTPVKRRSESRRSVADPSIKTPTDLAQYFADSVSTSDRPYRPFEWMVVWFAERLGETRWCGPTPEVPVVMSVATYVLAIDHWAPRNRHLVGRQIWPAWAEWVEHVDLLDEGVVRFSTGPSSFDKLLAKEAQEVLGINIDPELTDFREQIADALHDQGTSVAELMAARRERNAWLGRARQVHQIEVEDAEELGTEPPTLDEVLARIQAQHRAGVLRRRAERQRLRELEKAAESLGDLPDEDPEELPPPLGMSKQEAAALQARLAAAGEAHEQARAQAHKH